MEVIVPTTSAIREHNLRLVLDALRSRRPASRADLAIQTELSKPTVGGALRAFLEAGLAREYGRTTGRRGPSASLYDLVPDAVLALGVDIGARYIRFVLADLDGTRIEEESLPLPQPTAEAVLGCLSEIGSHLGPHASRIAAAAVGTPGVIDPLSGRIGSAPNISGWDGLMAEVVLSEALGLPVVVENDVNLACLGEQAAGGGAGVDSFVYLNIGTGLGAGIVLHGRLHRGARGAAGEVGFLPVGPNPFDLAARAHGGPMETRLSSQGLAETAFRLAAENQTAVPQPFDVQALFDAARRGDALGRAVVTEAARGIAVCIAGLTAVLDLDLVLLGGGIGASDDLLLPDIRTALAQLVPVPPRIERASLGDRAVRAGALSVALNSAVGATVRRLAARP
jgi:predicted NBD/HSP70 family sugar kinase